MYICTYIYIYKSIYIYTCIYTSHRQSLSSIQALLQSVNPYKIAEIFGGVWVGILGCIAAVVVPSTQILSFGMRVGGKIGSVCNSLFERAGAPAVSEDVRKWQTFLVDFVCYATSVTSFYL